MHLAARTTYTFLYLHGTTGGSGLMVGTAKKMPADPTRIIHYFRQLLVRSDRLDCGVRKWLSLRSASKQGRARQVEILAWEASLGEQNLDLRVSNCTEILFRRLDTSISIGSCLHLTGWAGRVFRIHRNSIGLGCQQFAVCAGRKQSIHPALKTPVG
jgi:hypothetical protein